MPERQRAKSRFFADLHLHSTFSDGTQTPTELVERVYYAGLSALALTDHDTTEGVAEATVAGQARGVEVIAGVELTAWHEREIHVLGYWVDPQNERLASTLSDMRTARVTRVGQITAKLAELGAPVDPEAVLASAVGNAGRPHIARALIAAGHVRSFDEAFRRYLGSDAPAYIPASRLTVEHAIELVHRAGGVAVLAHPGVDQVEPLIPALARFGLDGLEVDHPSHARTMRTQLRKRCTKLNLVPTGGSDFHHPPPVPILGLHGVAQETLIALRLRCRLAHPSESGALTPGG